MIKKALLIFVLLFSFVFVQPQSAYAFEFDFFGLRGAIDELVNGPKQEVEEAKIPSPFERFFSWVKGVISMGNFFPPKTTPAPTPIANPFPQTTTQPTSSQPPERSSLPDPESAGQPVNQAKNSLTGQWLGSFTVTAPEACKGESGGWTANLTQTGNSITGTFQSDAGGGSVSGQASANSFGWTAGGGGSDITFKGGSSSPNSISGTFTGQVCDEKEAPQKTSGTFFGGRIVQ